MRSSLKNIHFFSVVIISPLAANVAFPCMRYISSKRSCVFRNKSFYRFEDNSDFNKEEKVSGMSSFSFEHLYATRF